MTKVQQVLVMILEDVLVLIIGVDQNATNVYLAGLVKIVINVLLVGVVKIVINVPQDMMDTHIAKVSKQNKLVSTNVMCS